MKKRPFYGLGNSRNEGTPVTLPTVTAQTPDAELTTTRTTAAINNEPIKIGQNMSFCGGMTLESMLLLGGIVTVVAVIGHYSTK